MQCVYWIANRYQAQVIAKQPHFLPLKLILSSKIAEIYLISFLQKLLLLSYELRALFI
jgi:hypothetical protein